MSPIASLQLQHEPHLELPERWKPDLRTCPAGNKQSAEWRTCPFKRSSQRIDAAQVLARLETAFGASARFVEADGCSQVAHQPSFRLRGLACCLPSPTRRPERGQAQLAASFPLRSRHDTPPPATFFVRRPPAAPTHPGHLTDGLEARRDGGRDRVDTPGHAEGWDGRHQHRSPGASSRRTLRRPT